MSLIEQFQFNFLDDSRWQFIVSGLKNTIIITFFAVLLGVFLGFLIAIVRSTHDKTGKLKILNVICRVYLTVIRGTPTMVQLLIVYYVIFATVDPGKVIVAIIAFGMNSAAYVAEIVRSGIMSIDQGQFEAGRSLGLNYTQTMTKIILPQAVKNILPALGNMLLVDVTPADILRFYQQASSLSPSMCGKIRMCVNGIFRSACSNGLCTSNPADGCKLESMALPQIKEVYNDRQIEIASRWFLSRMPEVVLLLETGMRRGELVGLHPEDIDRRRRLYRVPRSIAWVSGKPVERSPKCGSYRVCPLSDRALQAIDALRRRYAGKYLISGDIALRPDTWSRRLKAEMARLAQAHPGMPELTAHELRHTYGTYLRRHGADIYSISKILGHKDISVTARIYVHNEIAELRKAVRWCNRREPIQEEYIP